MRSDFVVIMQVLEVLVIRMINISYCLKIAVHPINNTKGVVNQ